MKATIHQPDFMPWYGFFRKIAIADVWIVLDHSENNPRDSKFWGRRVKINVYGKEHWLSIPLTKPGEKGLIGLAIKDMTINVKEKKIFKNRLKTIYMAYQKAPFFRDFIFLVENYFNDSENNLVIRNMRFIKKVLKILEINTQIKFSSSFGVNSKSNQMLIELLKIVGAETYLCGLGSGGYQKDEMFRKSGINIEYNKFKHPIYKQIKAKEFIFGLSILDLLFMNGAEKVSFWINKK